MNVLELALEKLPQAKRYSHYVTSLCIFHKDTKPSFFVYEDFYICLACRAQGNSKQLISKLSSLPERIEVTYERPKSNNPFTTWSYSQSLPETIKISQRNLIFRTSNYLERRGICREKQISLGLGILDGYILFPILNKWNELDGALARVGENFKEDGRYYIPKGQNPNLLYVPSWSKIREDNQVYVTFGIFDAISIYLLGFAAASTTTGQSVNPKAFDDIRKKIIFVPDKHEEIPAIKTASKLSWRGDAAIINYPEHAKDPSDLFNTDRNLLYDNLLARSI